jgi:transposase
MTGNDLSRIEQFRQLKRHIRGSSHQLIVGIDVAKNKHHAFLGTATGKTVLKGLIFENSAAGIDKLLSRVQFYLDRDGFEQAVFGIEPTSCYHKPLAEQLIRRGHMLVYVTNEAIKKNRSLLDGRWDKNDPKDAANVADLISQGKCNYYDLPCARLQDVRRLLLLRKRLKKHLHSCRVRIRNNLVAQYFPELDTLWNQAEAENLAIVRWCLSPEKICRLDFDTFFKRVTSRKTGFKQYRRLRQIWQLAAESIGCPAGKALELEAKILVSSVEVVKEQIDAVEKEIGQLCRHFEEYQYLLSIPGFGPYISAVVLSAIGNPYRFDNARQLKRLAGYDLNARRSGKKSAAAVPVISKKGKAELRYALYQAALIASSLTVDFRAYYHRLLEGRQREKGIRTKMRVKLAVKLLIIAWTLMKTKQPFDPAHLKR